MGAGGLDGIAVGVIFVVGSGGTVDIHQPDHIALQVGDVVVNSVVITGCIALPHGDGSAVDIVEEIKDVVPIGHPGKLRTDIVVVINYTIDSLAGTQTVMVIGVTDTIGAVGCSCQLSAMLPSKVPPCTIVITGGIT